MFALEDLFGIQIGEIDGEVCLRLDKTKGTTYLSMFDICSLERNGVETQKR